MTMRLDIVTNDAGELVRREHARELGAGVVVALYRLARLAQLHDLANQAFLRQLEETHTLLRDYCLRAGSDVNILFAKRAVFVAGQLLKGNPAAYESATELGDVLEKCGGQELTIARDVTIDELRKLAEAISLTVKGKPFRAPSSRVRLRAVADAARLRGLEIEQLDQEQRIVRTYASAVVIMRRFFDDMRAGRYALPKRVKRIAQMLVDLSEGATPSFLGVTEARNANHDDAGRAVNTAILAVTVTRELTDDRAILSQIAMAAMMLDVGRPRALAAAQSPRLSEEAEDKLPAGTSAVLTALGRVNEATITRTVIAYEALWLKRTFLGPVYRGLRHATLQAKIVAIARRYNDLVTPEPGLAPPLPDFAIATLAEECKESADKTVLRMLVCALGLYPVGTVVQLSTREVGEILASPERRGAPDAPRLRLVMDERGDVIDKPLEVDLSKPRPGDPPRRIAKVLSIDGWKKGLDLAASTQPSGVRTTGDGPPSSRRAPPLEAPAELVAETPSTPSIGSTPSGVAEAFGRSLLEPSRSREAKVAIAPPPPSPREPAIRVGAPQPDRTVMAEGDVLRAKMASAQPRVQREPMQDRTPTAKGGLSATPLVHVLVYVLDHTLTGTVVFREPDGAESLVYFDEGAPAKVKTPRSVALLGDELVLAGLASREAIDKALPRAQKLGALFGEYLVKSGVVTEDTLQPVLVAQLKKKMAALANLPPETTYAFYRDVNALEHWGGEANLTCHPLDTILACVRDWYDRARIHATVSRIGRQALELHPEVDLASLTLTHDEETVLAVIRGEAPSLQSLQQRRVADEESIGSLVYTLAVTRQFAFPNQKAPPMARKHDERVRAASASSGGDRVSALPFFSAVVEPRAPSEKMKAASPDAETAATWRPPKPPSKPPQSSSAPASSSGPPSMDIGVDVEVEVGPPESEAHDEKVLQAMTDFRLAEAALQRRDVAMAERLALRAAEADPSQLGYVALLAWVQAMSGAPQATADAISALAQLLVRDPAHERALLYRGQLLTRAGRTAEAMRDFEKILEANPGHREAASELRLLKARRGK